jgi:hypothetical protein
MALKMVLSFLRWFYGFRILNAILNSLVCTMMKIFTHPTSASDFVFENEKFKLMH